MAGVGLGDGPKWWEDFEWVRLADVVVEAPPPRAARAARTGGAGATTAVTARTGRAGGRVLAPASDAALAAADLVEALWEQVDEARVWAGDGARLLLVDLDNLRAGPTRWQARMAVVVALARQADHVALAGQVGAVERALPHLGEFADLAEAVPDGSDLADHALLDQARAFADGLAAEGLDGPGQVVVASNDGIFADLVDDGWALTVLSPGHEALSDRLRDAARRTVDLTDAERAATRRWRSRALRAASLTPRRSGSGRATAGSSQARATSRRRSRARRG